MTRISSHPKARWSSNESGGGDAPRTPAKPKKTPAKAGGRVSGGESGGTTRKTTSHRVTGGEAPARKHDHFDPKPAPVRVSGGER